MDYWIFFPIFFPPISPTNRWTPHQLSVSLLNRESFYLSLTLRCLFLCPYGNEKSNGITKRTMKTPNVILFSIPFLVKQTLIFRTLNKLLRVPISCLYTCCAAKISLALQQGCTIVEMSKVEYQIQF